jgi:hypothetical protein
MMTDEELEEWKAHRKLVGDSLRNLEQSFEQTLQAIKYAKERYYLTSDFEGMAMMRDIEKRVLESRDIFEQKKSSQE